MKHLTVLSGAGISAESGLKTFRDADGLWEGHDIMEVASPLGWQKNPSLVLEFYNQRRRQLFEVKPNIAHEKIALLQSRYKVQIVTQNVDDLHERAGSKNVLHLHGELLKVRSVFDDSQTFKCSEDINIGDVAPNGGQLRPHIVWFGEAVPMMEPAIQFVQKAEILVIIGTSLQVYPAAGLINFANRNIPIYYIDPKPNISYELKHLPNLTVIPQKASVGILELENLLP